MFHNLRDFHILIKNLLHVFLNSQVTERAAPQQQHCGPFVGVKHRFKMCERRKSHLFFLGCVLCLEAEMSIRVQYLP